MQATSTRRHDGAQLSYDTEGGQHFDVSVSLDDAGAVTEMTVTGEHLTLKPEGDATGKVQAPSDISEVIVNDLESSDSKVDTAFVSNMDLNRAHIIADRFRDSGFRKACNVLSTSDHYNQHDMKGAEDLIVDRIKAQKDVKELEMSVTITLAKIDVNAMLRKLAEKDAAYKGPKIAQGIRARLTAMQSVGIQRIMKITHQAWVITSKNAKVQLGPFPKIGPDTRLGTKSK